MRGCGVLPYIIEIMKQSDIITAWAGLPTVLETMRALGLEKTIRETLQVRERQSGYSTRGEACPRDCLCYSSGPSAAAFEALRVSRLPGAA